MDERTLMEALTTLPARLLRTESLATVAGVVIATFLALHGATPEVAVGVTLPFVALVLGRSYDKGQTNSGAVSAVHYALEAAANGAAALGHTGVATAAADADAVVGAMTTPAPAADQTPPAA